MTELTVDIPMPPSVNHMYANVKNYGRVKTKEYKNWINEAQWMLVAQRNKGGKHTCLKGDVEVILRAYRPANKRRDLDNILKPVMDLLTSTKTIEDDRQIVSIDAKWVNEGVPCTITVRAA